MALNTLFDESASHDVVVAPAWEGEPWLVNALWGLYSRLVCATQANNQDGVLSFGLIHQFQPAETRHAIEMLVKYRYLEARDEQTWVLLKHDKLLDFEEASVRQWRNLRKKDNSNPDLVVPVLLRDGDQCRYCHRVVDWSSRYKTGGTFDHVMPGRPALTPDDLRVSCIGCNSGRGNRVDADVMYPAQPVPARPYYSEGTALRIREYGKARGDAACRGVRASGQSRLLPAVQVPVPTPARPADQADTAPEEPREPKAVGTPRTAPQGPASASQNDDNAGTRARPANQADNAAEEPPSASSSRATRAVDMPLSGGEPPGNPMVEDGMVRTLDPQGVGVEREGSGSGTGPGQGPGPRRSRRRGRRGGGRDA